jgi:hypothetical protein
MISIVVLITLLVFLRTRKKYLLILASGILFYLYERNYRGLELLEDLVLGQIIIVMSFLFIHKIIRLSMKSPTISLQKMKNQEEDKTDLVKYLFECYLTRCNKIFGLEVSMDMMTGKKEIVINSKLSIRILRNTLNIVSRFLSLGERSG